MQTKGLQLAVFLVLSVLLIPPFGPLGAAIAVVASDLLIQFGLLGITIIRQTLEKPFRHLGFLVAMMVLVTAAGWAIGIIVQSWLPGTGLIRFAGECGLWLMIVALAASPTLSEGFRNRLIALIPR